MASPCDQESSNAVGRPFWSSKLAVLWFLCSCCSSFFFFAFCFEVSLMASTDVFSFLVAVLLDLGSSLLTLKFEWNLLTKKKKNLQNAFM